MWTIINAAANLAITFQIVYLYTCGQQLMRILALRKRVNFNAERIILVVLSCLSFSNAILGTRPDTTEILLNVSVASYIAFIIYSIKQNKKHV